LKRTDPGMAQAQIVQAAALKTSSVMPEQTRDTLRRLADSMRRATSGEPVPVPAKATTVPSKTTPASPPARDPKSPPASKKAGDRRAEGKDPAQGPQR
jgi:hypothetical protein